MEWRSRAEWLLWKCDDSELAASAFSRRTGWGAGDAMSAVGRGLPVASGVQGGHAPATDTLQVMLVIVALALGSLLIALYLRRRQRRHKPVADQWQALAVMGELCPHGWQAQITLYGWGAPVPADAPPARVPLVELEWKQFDEESGRVAVTRRVWAPTIGEALQSMVEDRWTDVTLEQIEQAAEDEGDPRWSG
jgi:hypothetical protein